MSDRDGGDLFDGADSAAAKARAEERRQVAAQVVHGVYRLVKACLLHGDANQTVAAAVNGCVAAVAAFCEHGGGDSVMIQFAADSLFVNGQMLKTSRETYSLAMELAEYFATCGATDVTFDRQVTATELSAFGRLVADGQRDAKLAKTLVGTVFRHVRARSVQATAASGDVVEDVSPAARIVRTYAASIVVMRAFYEEQRRGGDKLPHRVKRVAQKLVSHIEEDAHLLVVTSVASAIDRDRASTSVSTACIALGMARQLTADRQVLAGVAMAALLYDVGRLRLVRGRDGEAPQLERALSDGEVERLPASSVVALTALGRLHAPSVARTVIAFEAQWLRDRGKRGPLYGGRRAPWVTARILAVARAFAELRWPGPNGVPIGADDATQLLYARASDATDKVIVKLLVGALGIFPAGTMIELTTGEMGVVMESPAHPIDFARPRVRLMYDARGALLATPVDLDLAEARRGNQPLMIKRSIDAEDQHMKAMRAYAQAAAAKRGLLGDPPAPAAPPPKLHPSEVPTISAVGPGAQPQAPPPAPRAAAPRAPLPSRPPAGSGAYSAIQPRVEKVTGIPPSPRVEPASSQPAPRSSVPPSRVPVSDRDKLLSAFLADEPMDLPDGDTPPSRRG